jgi:hypothetical protein
LQPRALPAKTSNFWELSITSQVVVVVQN